MSHEHEEQQRANSKTHVTGHEAGSTQGTSRSNNDSSHMDGIWTPKSSGDAIAPLLHGLDRDLERSLAALDVEEDTQEHRAQVVDVAARELDEASRIAAALLDAEPATGRMRYQAAADRVALSVNRLLRFVRTRKPHRDLEQQFMVGVTSFDQVLAKLGAPTIESRATAVLSERATHTAEIQDAKVNDGKLAVLGALKKMKDRQKQAITDFFSLAQLEDHEEPPFFEQLLKSVALALSVELTEVFLSLALAKGVAEEAAHLGKAAEKAQAIGHKVEAAHLAGAAHHAMEKAESRELLVKLLAGTAEGTFDAAVEGGDGERAAREDPHEHAPHHEGEVKVDGKAVALVYLTSRLQDGITDRFAGYDRSLDHMVKGGAVGELDLYQMEATFNATLPAIHEQYMTRASKAWATYLSQSRLGAHFAGNRKVSDMNDYFGEHEGNGRAFGTDKSGGDGVLSVVFEVEAAGKRPRLSESETKIIGVNSLLKNLILREAEHRFARVSLPKEVHVEARFARATIALDENNRIRDVQGWQEIEPYVGETANQFWAHWGKDLEIV